MQSFSVLKRVVYIVTTLRPVEEDIRMASNGSPSGPFIIFPQPLLVCVKQSQIACHWRTLSLATFL
jgi:hypothetical protein